MLSTVLTHWKMLFTDVPIYVFPLYLQIHFMSCQFSAVVTCCIWEAQLVRVLWQLSLCCCLSLVKCGGTCWNHLEPEFEVCLVTCFLSCSCTFFRTWGLVSVFCLFLCFFFKQLICDRDSLLWTHLTSENLGPWEVSELPGYREGLDKKSK